MSGTTPTPDRGLKPRLALLAIAGGVVLLDQLTKAWAVSALSASPRELIRGFLYFDLAHNTGAAFSLFERHPEVLTGVASLVAVIVGIWLLKTDPAERLTSLSLSLILGGAAGNLIDRYTVGHVTDFIRVYFGIIDWSWPTFNVADSAICAGMGLLIWSTFINQPAKEAELAPGPEAKGQDSRA